VPAGNKEKWVSAPYEAKVLEGMLIGRGAADMKGSIAAFIAAFARHHNDYNNTFAVSFLINRR
jgi:succinyl-diaminopimelate desuccinylase